jgi:hypothetical protein
MVCARSADGEGFERVRFSKVMTSARPRDGRDALCGTPEWRSGRRSHSAIDSWSLPRTAACKYSILSRRNGRLRVSISRNALNPSPLIVLSRMTRPSGKVPQGALVILRRGDPAAFCFRHRGWQEVGARQRGRGWLCADPARQMQPLPGSKCHSELRWPAHVRWRKVVASRLMAQRTPPRLWRIGCPRDGPLSTSDSARPGPPAAATMAGASRATAPLTSRT